MIDDATLTRWRAVTDKATAGPWSNLSLDGEPIESVWTDAEAIATCDTDAPSFAFHASQAREDAAFIAEARTAMPALLDEMERLKREIAELQPKRKASR